MTLRLLGCETRMWEVRCAKAGSAICDRHYQYANSEMKLQLSQGYGNVNRTGISARMTTELNFGDGTNRPDTLQNRPGRWFTDFVHFRRHVEGKPGAPGRGPQWQVFVPGVVIPRPPWRRDQGMNASRPESFVSGHCFSRAANPPPNLERPCTRRSRVQPRNNEQVPCLPPQKHALRRSS